MEILNRRIVVAAGETGSGWCWEELYRPFITSSGIVSELCVSSYLQKQLVASSPSATRLGCFIPVQIQRILLSDCEVTATIAIYTQITGLLFSIVIILRSILGKYPSLQINNDIHAQYDRYFYKNWRNVEDWAGREAGESQWREPLLVRRASRGHHTVNVYHMLSDEYLHITVKKIMLINTQAGNLSPDAIGQIYKN